MRYSRSLASRKCLAGGFYHANASIAARCRDCRARSGPGSNPGLGQFIGLVWLLLLGWLAWTALTGPRTYSEQQNSRTPAEVAHDERVENCTRDAATEALHGRSTETHEEWTKRCRSID
jgi:hypothetical protein